MDDIYPGMTYNEPLSSAMGLYIYGSILLGILGTIALFCSREPNRIYRITKRKNTDDSPILQV